MNSGAPPQFLSVTQTLPAPTARPVYIVPKAAELSAGATMDTHSRSCQDKPSLCLVGFISGSVVYCLSAIISLLSYIFPLQAGLPQRIQTHKRRHSHTIATTATVIVRKVSQPLQPIILSPPGLRTPPTLQRHVSFSADPQTLHKPAALVTSSLAPLPEPSTDEPIVEEGETPSPHGVGEFGERLLTNSPPPIEDATFLPAPIVTAAPLRSSSTSRIKQKCQERRARRTSSTPAPIPRTQPYAAPFFFPTPDSPDAVDYVNRVREERMQVSHRSSKLHVQVMPIAASLSHSSPTSSAPSSTRGSSEPLENDTVAVHEVPIKIELPVNIPQTPQPKRRHSWMLGSRSANIEGEEKAKRRLSWLSHSRPGTPTANEQQASPSPSRSLFRRKKIST